MKHIKIILSVLALSVMFIGCSHDHSHAEKVTEEEHDHGAISVTKYSEKLEVFMEYPELLANNESEFLIHLTNLKDFKAIKQGELTLEFNSEEGKSFSVVEKAPVREGIYISNVKLGQGGHYELKLSLNGKDVIDEISIDHIHVYDSHGELHAKDNDLHNLEHDADENHVHADDHQELDGHNHDDDEQHAHDHDSDNDVEEEFHSEEEGISFLKEQQWKVSFANEEAQLRKMQNVITATGELLAKPEFFAKVISPIEGIIIVKNNPKLKSPGSEVKKGEVLLTISATADSDFSLQKLKSEYFLSKAEFERVDKLYNKGAVSKKRFEEAKSDFESKEISYTSISDQIKITKNGYSVIAPINGVIESIDFHLGDQITSGQVLFTIINPARLLLKANVPSNKINASTDSEDACFLPEGFKTEFRISELNGKKISSSPILNRVNRTVPTYYEFENPNNILKVGMFADVHVRVGEESEFLTIPGSSIIDEDGMETAYVQLEGELFEKRILKTGIRDEGYVQIISGIKEGERVVSKGAYLVRLAGLNTDSAIGHGHVH